LLGAQGLWAGRDLYRATPAVTRDLGFSGLIRKGPPHLVASYDTEGVWRIYSKPDPHGKVRAWYDTIRPQTGCLVTANFDLDEKWTFNISTVHVHVIDPPHPQVCCKCRLYWEVFRTRQGKPRLFVSAGVARWNSLPALWTWAQSIDLNFEAPWMDVNGSQIARD
jgi:hypothetical protein